MSEERKCEHCGKEVKKNSAEIDQDILRTAFMMLLDEKCGKFDPAKKKMIYDQTCLKDLESVLDIVVGFGWVNSEQVKKT